MSIHEEICPYCERKIRASDGVRPCPKCGGPVRITPDQRIDWTRWLLPALLVRERG